MIQFLQDLSDYAFLQYALAAAVLAALPCGAIGSFIVIRRSTYVAGAISHCVLGGMGLACYLRQVHGVAGVTPLMGATGAAVLAALLVGLVTASGRERLDTVLSAVWAVGMAVGISFIAATPGYSRDLMSYLFGNILMVRKGDLMLMLLLDVVVGSAFLLYYDRFLAISFNPLLARLRGVRVEGYELFFLVLTALTIVLLVQVVGIVLAIALLTLPGATAGLFSRRLAPMILLSIAFSLTFTVGGLALSYGPGWPTGATIIELAAALYLICAGIVRCRDRLRRRPGRVPPGASPQSGGKGRLPE